MTQIKIEVPANDHIALSAMADALQRIAAERTPSVTVGDSQVEQCDTLIKQCEEFKTPKGDDFVEPVDVEIARMDEEFEKGEKLYDAEIARMDEEREQLDDTLDADNLPWDKRIHSRGKTRLSDNTWRLARKPNDKTDEEWTAYVESVKSELKAVQDIPVTPPEAEFTEQQAIDVIGNANDNPMDIVEPTAVDETHEGPFYWSNDESCSVGKVETLEELHTMIEGGVITEQISKDDYDRFVEIGYDNDVNNVTPATALTITPPIADEPAVQMEGVTPNGDVVIEPPVTTVGSPIAPVTPPTSLTPPVVEPTEAPSDQPSVTTFQELMLYITGNAKKRGADNDMIKATLAEVDPALTAIPLIATRADLIPKFVTALEAKLS